MNAAFTTESYLPRTGRIQRTGRDVPGRRRPADAAGQPPRRGGDGVEIDAGLNADHQLVTSGPYGVVRHPIYTSMLCALLGTGFMISKLPLLILAVLVFVAGTEIRVRIEERLLASRFADSFSDYRRNVPAYIPFVR